MSSGATRLARLVVALALGALAAVPAAIAQSTASAGARAGTRIILPLQLSNAAELSFGRLSYSGSGQDGLVILPAKAPSTRVAVRVTLLPNGGETPLVRRINGEPGFSYRISLPQSVRTTSGNLLVGSFTLWSQNSRDVTASRSGQLDALGMDVLRVGATLTVPKGTRNAIYSARVPVTIAYE